MDNYITSQLLSILYEAFFKGDTKCHLGELSTAQGWDVIEFRKIVDRLSHDKLIEPYSLGGYFKITSFGIIYTETEIKEPANIIEENELFRTEILKRLAEKYDKSGIGSRLDYHALKKEFDDRLLNANIDVLRDLDYIKFNTNSSFSITYQGLEAVEEWKRKVDVVSEFDSISNLSPQSRGRKFQSLFAKLVGQSNWAQEESVKTSHEEMDVIIFKEREYYLTECKWEKDPIEAPVIREVKGKLDNRIDVRGIVVSMSGFTSGAEEQVAQYMSQRVVLLFGPEDVRALIYHKSSFDDLLNDKYRALVTKGQVLFS